MELIKFLADFHFIVDRESENKVFLEEKRVLGIEKKFEVFYKVFCLVTKMGLTFDQEVVYRNFLLLDLRIV
jgi:hypothetical protein